MGNSVKNAFDRALLIKDIEDRECIINLYRTTGFLDRNDAIGRIQELRISDEEVARITSVKMIMCFIPFSQCTDEQIIAELLMQRDILKAKLAEKPEEGQQK